MNSPTPKTPSQVGTIAIGAGAGLALCAILFSFVLSQRSSQPLVRLAS
jgi:hypothetical protein